MRLTSESLDLIKMDITLAIASQLERIVPNATIYRENVEQGFEEPSFYVYEIIAKSQGNLMDYQMRNHDFCIMWFPNTHNEDVGVKEQCEKMRETLLDAFDFIDDLSLNVLAKEARIEQEALNLTFTLKYRVTKEDTGTPLTDLTQKGDVKHA